MSPRAAPLAAALCFATAAHGERHFSAMPAAAPKAAPAERMFDEIVPRAIHLGPLAAERVETLRKAPSHGALRIGEVRELAQAPATWTEVPGGRVSRWRVEVAEARAMRLRLDVAKSAPGVRARFASSRAPDRVVAQPLDAPGMAWGPVTEGEASVVEVFAPAEVPAESVEVTLAAAADHFVDLAKWRALPCHTDLICEARHDGALAGAGTASLKISWVQGHGVYACSATLLNPADGSFRPYVMTAAHCVGDADAARSVVAHWLFHKETCGGEAARADSVQVGGGATLLAVDEQLDAALLRLHADPPPGVTYAGWDSTALAPGERAIAIHHANAEVAKVSHARVLPPPPYPFAEVAWTAGIVQGGSSGSGLFTRVASPRADLLFRGSLSAASASCASPGMGLYSRLDELWPRVAPFLSTAPEHANATGLWWDAGEPGWGVSLNQQGDVLFALLFVYDESGSPAWLVASDARKSGGGFSGTLYRMAPAAAPVGELRLELVDANEARLAYSFGGRSHERRLSRQVFGRFAPVCTAARGSRKQLANYQDLWWNPGEPGWGIAIAHQDDTLFATVFTYDERGRDTWYVASRLAPRGRGGFEGELYRMSRASGAPAATSAGSLAIDFADGERATLRMKIGERLVTQPITRQVFGAAPPACH